MISSQVSERGGNGEVVDVLLDNPVIITFSFEAVCLRRIASSSRNGVCVYFTSIATKDSLFQEYPLGTLYFVTNIYWR